MSTWIFITLVIFWGILYFISVRKTDAKMFERFADREPISFEVFYEQYYAGLIDRKLVHELVEHVASELSIPANKLRPDDRFDLELKPLSGWEFDSGQNILFVEIIQLARKKSKEIDLNTIRTLDDYIKIMSQVY